MNQAVQKLLRRAQDRLEFAANVGQLEAEPNVLIAGLAEAVHQAVATETKRERDRLQAVEMFECLPARQRDVAVMAAKGYTDKEISEAIGSSSNAAHARRHKAMNKLGVENLQMLAVLAYKAGLICNHDD